MLKPGTLSATVALALTAAPISAQVSGRSSSNGCISVADASSRVAAAGKLVESKFTDSYGTERAFILELPNAICLDDGGEFTDPAMQFSKVHVSAVNDELILALSSAVGRQVTVSGEAFSAHTRHHHAPLVLLADKVELTGGGAQ